MRDGVKIKIFGVGGGGGNAVKRICDKNLFKNVNFIVANTDVDALEKSFMNMPEDRVTVLKIGEELTKGLGAGGKPIVGSNAALESQEVIKNLLAGTDLLFIAAGMGGGTGTGAAPVIAKIAKEMDILTVAVVTKPFRNEGPKKMQIAEKGVSELKKYADVLMVVPNQKVSESLPKKSPASLSLTTADNVLQDCIAGITEIVTNTTTLNVDFADVLSVIKDAGTAHIGVGSAKGENRAVAALTQAASSLLLETSIEGATKVIVQMIVDPNFSTDDQDDILDMISEVADKDFEFFLGFDVDENLEDEIFITIVATGSPEYKDEDTALVEDNSYQEDYDTKIADMEVNQEAIGSYLKRISDLKK